jgi:hypothetical protein
MKNLRLLLAIGMLLAGQTVCALDTCVPLCQSNLPAQFKQAGFNYLISKTNPQKVVSMIKMGALVTGDKVPLAPTGIGIGANRPGKVFFDLTAFNDVPKDEAISFFSSSYGINKGVESGDLALVAVVVDLEALSKLKYHVSGAGWINYGAYSPSSDLLSSKPSTYEPFFRKGLFGEVVFYEDVPFKFVRSIWVHPDKRAELLKTLRDNGILEINGKSIEEFIPFLGCANMLEPAKPN